MHNPKKNNKKNNKIMKTLLSYIIEAEIPNQNEMTSVPVKYQDTLLGVFWNSIRTVAEKRTLGWTNFSKIKEPVMTYIKANRGVPTLTKFGTGKKLPCGDMVRFISCVLANIKVSNSSDTKYMQQEVDKILKDLDLDTCLYITIGDVDGFIDSYLTDISLGVRFYTNKVNKSFEGIQIRWSKGHIDMKI